MITAIGTAAAYFTGSLPFASWLSRRRGVDIRTVGDGNPGAVNAGRAAGWPIGLAVLVLDFLKGAAPVGLWHWAGGLGGWFLALVMVAAVLGHAFSPFLRGRGGKAIAVTFGVWAGAAAPGAPICLGLALAAFWLFVDRDAWVVVFALLTLGAWLILEGREGALLAAWAANGAVVIWKHRVELRSLPRFRFKIRRQVGV